MRARLEAPETQAPQETLAIPERHQLLPDRLGLRGILEMLALRVLRVIPETRAQLVPPVILELAIPAQRATLDPQAQQDQLVRLLARLRSRIQRRSWFPARPTLVLVRLGRRST